MLQILVVEDEHSISNLIKVNLTRAGLRLRLRLRWAGGGGYAG